MAENTASCSDLDRFPLQGHLDQLDLFCEPPEVVMLYWPQSFHLWGLMQRNVLQWMAVRVSV